MARPNGHFRGLKGHESIAQTSAWVYISNENRPEAEGAAEIVFRKYANSPYLAGSKLDKAQKLGVQIVDEEKFKEMIG